MQGVVDKVTGKDWNGKTLWSFTLRGDRTYYRVGERKPSILSEGASVSFDAVAKGTGTSAQNITSWSGGGIQTGATAAAVASNNGVSKDDYWAAREARDVLVQKRIERQSCRNSALQLVSTILVAGALKLPKDQKDQVKVIEELVAKYTDDFINDNDNKPAEAEGEASIGQIEPDATGDDWS